MKNIDGTYKNAQKISAKTLRKTLSKLPKKFTFNDVKKVLDKESGIRDATEAKVYKRIYFMKKIGAIESDGATSTGATYTKTDLYQ